MRQSIIHGYINSANLTYVHKNRVEDYIDNVYRSVQCYYSFCADDGNNHLIEVLYTKLNNMLDTLHAEFAGIDHLMSELHGNDQEIFDIKHAHRCQKIELPLLINDKNIFVRTIAKNRLAHIS